MLTQIVHHTSHNSSGPADVMVPHVGLRVQCTANKPEVVKGGACVLGVWREPGSIPRPPPHLPLPCTRGGMKLCMGNKGAGVDSCFTAMRGVELHGTPEHFKFEPVLPGLEVYLSIKPCFI